MSEAVRLEHALSPTTRCPLRRRPNESGPPASRNATNSPPGTRIDPALSRTERGRRLIWCGATLGQSDRVDRGPAWLREQASGRASALAERSIPAHRRSDQHAVASGTSWPHHCSLQCQKSSSFPGFARQAVVGVKVARVCREVEADRRPARRKDRLVARHPALTRWLCCSGHGLVGASRSNADKRIRAERQRGLWHNDPSADHVHRRWWSAVVRCRPKLVGIEQIGDRSMPISKRKARLKRRRC